MFKESEEEEEEEDPTYESMPNLEIVHHECTLKCTECNYKSPTFELFWHLAVPIPKKNSIDLHDCLAQFMLEEVLKGDNMPVSVAFECSQQRLNFQ